MNKIIDNQLYAGGAKIPGGGQGGGAVDSVNGKTGDVILNSADVGATTKNIITLTGESGTLTSAQIAQVQDDTAVLEIVCDGIVFRLSNKDSTLTYRTFISTDCALSENVSFKAIYVQLNSEAANYGAWSLEEVSAGGAEIDDSSTALDKVWSASKLNTMIGNIESLLANI